MLRPHATPARRRQPAASPTRSLTDQVHDALKHEIVTAALAPGEALNEPELAARYGVSKTPVREALRLMAQAGWVVTLPRRGYLVRPLALEDIRQIFALRRMLEPPLAAEAARRATDSSVVFLQELIARQSASQQDFEQTVSSAREFHLAIAELSGNARAARMLCALVDEVVRLTYLMPRLESNLRSVTELEAHADIVQAIDHRDADGAAALMRAHLVVAGRGMTQAFGDAG